MSLKGYEVRALKAWTETEWQQLLDKDDRTSPEEYPDMCLITKRELIDIVISAAGLVDREDGGY